MVAAAFACCCCVAENLHPSDNGKLMQQAVGNLHPALNLHGWEIITGSSGSQKRVTRLSLGHAHLHGPALPHFSSSTGLPSHQPHHNGITFIISNFFINAVCFSSLCSAVFSCYVNLAPGVQKTRSTNLCLCFVQ